MAALAALALVLANRHTIGTPKVLTPQVAHNDGAIPRQSDGVTPKRETPLPQNRGPVATNTDHPTGNTPHRQTPTPHAPTPDKLGDADFLNPGRTGSLVAFNTPDGRNPYANLPPMKDDFVEPPPILVAAIGSPDSYDEIVKRQKEEYEKQRNISDARLYKEITLSLKYASMDELCAELKRQTGVDITAGRNVADDNVTIFIGSRPVREVMREISRVFGFIWERNGSEGAYTYMLKQDTAAQIAEEKLRNDDVSKSIETLSRNMRMSAVDMNPAQSAFQSLSLGEMDILRTGRELRLGSPNMEGLRDGLLAPSLVKQLLRSGGARKDGDVYMAYNGEIQSDMIPFEKLEDPSAGVFLQLRVTELGGAFLSGNTYIHGKNPDGSHTVGGLPFDIGHTPGPGEAPLNNAKDNQACKSSPGFDAEADIAPNPTVPVDEQGTDPEPLRFGTITELIGSYRTLPALQPPRPFMNSADVWQAIHEKTKKDIVADSFSRLFPLHTYKGSLYSVLSNACDEMHYRWRLDEGFITGRSATFHWQRLNEVPKRNLVYWQALKAQNGWLPLKGVLAMSQMTDRQLDSYEVGKAIAHQWKLDEWGIPSRPHLPRDVVRKLCRFLAGLPADKLARAEKGTLVLSDLPEGALNGLSFGPTTPDTVLRIDYVPPGKYYWAPFFEQGKEEPHDDLIFADTAETVLREVNKRYPKTDKTQVSLSNGLLDVLLQKVPETPYSGKVSQLGDQRFFVGFRLGD